MIEINGNEIDPKKFAAQFPPNGIEARAIDIMGKSGAKYRYESDAQLKFELELRKNIVNAAKDLSRSGLAFRVFRKSKCNPEFWTRTSDGGFKLLSGVKPSDAMRDIYENGSQYGTECATAMVIVYYKALLDTLPEELFNKLFSDITLMNWQHLDPDLGIVTLDKPPDYFPGDARYVKNPDVDPLTPEWQGENIFDLGGGQYYGHGIGITTTDRIIDALNTARIEGSTRSAFLMTLAERPDFRNLYRKYADFNARGGAQQASFTDSFWQAWNRSVI
jgi:protein-glutamine gamma-glutamyltransferase